MGNRVDYVQYKNFSVGIKVLTVGDIENFLKNKDLEERSDLEQDEYDMIKTILIDFSIFDLLRFTDLTREKINSLTPSELKLVVAKIKEKNEDFFLLETKMVERTRTLQSLTKKVTEVTEKVEKVSGESS